MKLITPFDPSTASSGVLDTLGINPNEQLMLYNDTIYGLLLKFDDGSVDVIPALWNKDFILERVAMAKVSWSVYNQLNLVGNPISQVYGTLYEPGEHVARVNASMQRSVNIANPGGVPSNVTALVNSGQPGGTAVITISDSLGNTFTLDNDGIMLLATKVSAALVQQIKTQTADPLLILGAATHTIEAQGDIQVDGKLQGKAASNLQYNVPTGQKHSFQVNAVEQVVVDSAQLKVSGGNLKGPGGSTTFLMDSAGTGVIQFQVNGTNIFQATSTGPNLNASMSYKFLVGTMSKQNGNGATTCGNGTVISHGLATTPALVVATPNIAQPGSATVGIGAIGATTFTATIGAGSLISWWCLVG